MRKLKIAVIGSGISGLAAAWLLAKRHQVVLFERDLRPGGHANTYDVATPGGTLAIDTGFIVYNAATYPNLTALFDYLDVTTAKSCMSFSVSLGQGRYEYSGTGLAGLFGQPSNIFRIDHIRLVRDIARFFRTVGALDPAAIRPDVTLGAWLAENGFSRAFSERHILPMAAAIWSASARQMMDFPFATFARFFANHGLLRLRDRPQWRTIFGGSREYVRKLLEDYDGELRLGFDIKHVRRSERGVDIIAGNGAVQRFDHCVLAAHADQALAMLSDADDLECSVLSAFRYAANDAILHTDEHLMPRRRRLWSSWNYCTVDDTSEMMPGVTYWMNSLQPLPGNADYFVSLNPAAAIAPDRHIASFRYRHPVFDQAAMDGQQRLWRLQGRRRTWFAGSYFGYGFHEDGLQAGLAVAEQLGGIRRPWRATDESGRIAIDRPALPDVLEAAQ